MTRSSYLASLPTTSSPPRSRSRGGHRRRRRGDGVSRPLPERPGGGRSRLDRADSADEARTAAELGLGGGHEQDLRHDALRHPTDPTTGTRARALTRGPRAGGAPATEVCYVLRGQLDLSADLARRVLARVDVHVGLALLERVLDRTRDLRGAALARLARAAERDDDGAGDTLLADVDVCSRRLAAETVELERPVDRDLRPRLGRLGVEDPPAPAGAFGFGTSAAPVSVDLNVYVELAAVDALDGGQFDLHVQVDADGGCRGPEAEGSVRRCLSTPSRPSRVEGHDPRHELTVSRRGDAARVSSGRSRPARRRALRPVEQAQSSTRWRTLSSRARPT